VLSRRNSGVPVIGARKRRQLEDSLAAAELSLSAADIAEIETAVPTH
jgi:aryl-alcohol dehydrogenase-like predicted oxidoreductase